MVTYSTNELISSSEFAKKFGTYLAQIKDNSVEKLAILKNNKVEAVIISKDEYENMKEALTQIEAKKIIDSIQSGLDDMKSGKTKSIVINPANKKSLSNIEKRIIMKLRDILMTKITWSRNLERRNGDFIIFPYIIKRVYIGSFS